MKPVRTGGGWPAVAYAWRKARQAGGVWPLYEALKTPNTCKGCALGMRGMADEAGHTFQVCKKSIQAMVGDMDRPVAESFWNRPLAELQALSPAELEGAGRLTRPVLARDGRFREVSWDAALDHLGAVLGRTDPERSFWYFSGRSSNEAAFLLQLFARRWGARHINNVAFYCHQASGVALNAALGTSTATVVLDDLDHCDTVFLLGANPASNHPRLMHKLAALRARGGRVVVVNPVREVGLENFSAPGRPASLLFGTAIASDWVQPHAGGDLALFAGMAKALVAADAVDHAFIAAHTTGWAEVVGVLDALDWSAITAASGVDRARIEDLAQIHAASSATVFAWTLGLTHHRHGTDTLAWVINLALMRGMVGRPHAGLLPLRGHSNIQGVGSMATTPGVKPAIAARLAERFGIAAEPGLDTLACLEAAHDGAMDLAVCLGGNLFGASPDTAYMRDAFAGIDQVVHLSTKLNTGHLHGLGRETLILPVLARDEVTEVTTQESMFNHVRYSQGGVSRQDGPRSELALVAEIAARVRSDGGAIDWVALADPDRVRELIAKVIPDYASVPRGDAFQIPGRTFHAPRFNTPDGRARFHGPLWPDPGLAPGQLRLITLRSEGQFNTVVYETHDLYRGIDRRDVVLIHPDDLAVRDLADGAPVIVTSATGALTVTARAFDRVRPGNVLMYFPEANVLVGREADPRSRTPAYKSVAVDLRAVQPSSSHAVSTGAAPGMPHSVQEPS